MCQFVFSDRRLRFWIATLGLASFAVLAALGSYRIFLTAKWRNRRPGRRSTNRHWAQLPAVSRQLNLPPRSRKPHIRELPASLPSKPPFRPPAPNLPTQPARPGVHRTSPASPPQAVLPVANAAAPSHDSKTVEAASRRFQRDPRRIGTGSAIEAFLKASRIGRAASIARSRQVHGLCSHSHPELQERKQQEALQPAGESGRPQKRRCPAIS
jgi:hypothetical protein